MPTLQRRADGCYFIRHFYRDHSTWQVLGEGVRYLQRRGINEGSWFSTDGFMDLYMRGLVYHGDGPRQNLTVQPRDTVEAASLRKRVREFHNLVHQGSTDQAWTFVWERVPDSEVRLMFSHELSREGGPRLSSWVIKDLVIYDIPADSSASFNNAKRLGIATVGVQVSNAASPNGEIELTEYWFEFGDGWLFAYSGFFKEA